MHDKPLRRLLLLGHPRRQQGQCAIRLSDHEVFGASMVLRTEHRDGCAITRVKGIEDPNLKCRTLGSMTLFRQGWAKRT